MNNHRGSPAGGEGNDLYGGPDNDELRGDEGNDSLFTGGSCAFEDGSEFGDCEFTGYPDNRLYGGPGDDDLHGSQDASHDEGDGDVLDGAEGRDLLEAASATTSSCAAGQGRTRSLGATATTPSTPETVSRTRSTAAGTSRAGGHRPRRRGPRRGEQLRDREPAGAVAPARAEGTARSRAAPPCA